MLECEPPRCSSVDHLHVVSYRFSRGGENYRGERWRVWFGGGKGQTWKGRENEQAEKKERVHNITLEFGKPLPQGRPRQILMFLHKPMFQQLSRRRSLVDFVLETGIHKIKQLFRYIALDKHVVAVLSYRFLLHHVPVL